MLRIRALGGLAVEQDGAPVSGAAAQPRRLAILAVLARAGARGASRERLLALLWPDANEEATRSVLNHALYTLRRDLGSADAIAGVRELRLEPSIVESDVAEFEELVASGTLERAVAVYTGPFLDGFRLPGNPEFERWVETERDALSHRYADVLERLARATGERGDWLAAAGWWRRLAALDPLNARVTIELMRALAAAGDRAGALQHARIYEALLEEHLDLAPDRHVVELARQLREEPAPAAPSSQPVPVASAAAVATEQPAPVPSAAAVAPNESGSARPAWWKRPVIVGPAIAAVVITAIVVASQVTDDESPIVAIGQIADYRGEAAEDLTAPLADMLATNLARAPSLRVVSSARMLEMLTRVQADKDTTAVYIRAARLAGATEVIEGAIVPVATGGYRLDLRRVTLANGTISDAQTVRGKDLFSLADSGSLKLLATLGHQPAAGSIADVTTRSLAAYSLYARGLKRYQAGDIPIALELFEGAVAEDSTFAMASYWASLAIGLDWRSPNRRRMVTHLERAVRLSANASDRERLVIRTWWARANSSPTLRAVAETLSVRYPQELDGHVQSGAAAILAGDFLGATVPFERAIRLDSLVMSTGVVRCGGCEAIELLVRAWVGADSVAAAERVARRALRISAAQYRFVRAACRGARLSGPVQGVEGGDRLRREVRVRADCQHVGPPLDSCRSVRSPRPDARGACSVERTAEQADVLVVVQSAQPGEVRGGACGRASLPRHRCRAGRRTQLGAVERVGRGAGVVGGRQSARCCRVVRFDRGVATGRAARAVLSRGASLEPHAESGGERGCG